MVPWGTIRTAQVRKRVYAETAIGVKEDLNPQSITPTESFSVRGNPFLSPSFTSMSSTFTTQVTFIRPIVRSTSASSHYELLWCSWGTDSSKAYAASEVKHLCCWIISSRWFPEKFKVGTIFESNHFTADAEFVEMQKSTELTQCPRSIAFAAECHVLDMQQSTKQFCLWRSSETKQIDPTIGGARTIKSAAFVDTD